MLHLIKLDRNYSPEAAAVMTAAFDRVCRSVAPSMHVNIETLALIILRHVEAGERNIQRLADVAIREWTGADCSETVDRSATG